jgi:hypothetical protein
MLEDIATRSLREPTQRDYVRFVQSFEAIVLRPSGAPIAASTTGFAITQATAKSARSAAFVSHRYCTRGLSSSRAIATKRHFALAAAPDRCSAIFKSP